MDEFSSDRLPASDRKAGYEAALRAYFGDDYVDKHVRVETSQQESFAGMVHPFSLGLLKGGYHMSNAPHTVYLAPSDNTTGGLDLYYLLDGEIDFECDSGPVRLQPGEMTLLRSSEPLSSLSRRMEMIALCLPERLLHRRLVGRPLAINRTMSGVTGIGACLGALLRAAAQPRIDLSLEDRLVLQSSVVDVALHLASTDVDASDPTAPQYAVRLRLLQRCALDLLRNPNLSPLHLAEDAGVSVRTVHRLFHESGATFREWLRERRLERCWEELTNPVGRRRTVADVAFRWGFNDLTTFNRSFRAKYGVPPTAARLARSLQ